MKFLLSGYYGYNNTGDEAILEVITAQIRKHDPFAEFVIPSPLYPLSLRERGDRVIPRYNPVSLIKALKTTDVLISGGGGLLQDSTGLLTIPYYLTIIALSKFLKKKTVFLGQGFGPVKRKFNKWLVKKTLNNVDLITVRDETSLKELRKIGVLKPPMLLCADPAFLLQTASPSNILKNENLAIENKPIVGISVRTSLNTNDGFCSFFAKSLDLIIEKYNIQVIFIPFHYPFDTDESKKIVRMMKNKAAVLTKQYSPQEILGIINSMDLFIGMRLHSLIFCANASMPMIGINYDPKVKAFLDEYNLPCLKENFCIKELTDAFENIWNNKETISKNIKNHTEIMKSKAQLNFKALFEYCRLEPENKSRFGGTSCLGSNILWNREVYSQVPYKAQIDFFGVKVDLDSFDEAIAKAEEFIKSGIPHLITTPNPEIIVTSQKDQELKNIINSSDLRLPDGSGLILIARILKLPLRHRITGIDFMLKIFDLAKTKSYKIFLLGSSQQIVTDAEKKLRSQGINIVGSHDGYFDDSQSSEIVEMIKKAEPDILFVGLGAPRQEKWLSKYYKEMVVPFNMVIGGSLDVVSGNKQRAPQFTQTLGIEWLWRLLKEPYRWRRQLALIKFTLMAIKKRYKFQKMFV